MYLGRYQQGQEVPFWVRCTDSSGTPVNPDAAPSVDVSLAGTGVIQAQKLVPVQDPAATTGFFQGFLYLDDTFAVGTYTLNFRWQVGGFVGADSSVFEVVDGGDPSGQVLAMTYYHQPQADFYVQQRTSGRIYQGKNPRV